MPPHWLKLKKSCLQIAVRQLSEGSQRDGMQQVVSPFPVFPDVPLRKLTSTWQLKNSGKAQSEGSPAIKSVDVEKDTIGKVSMDIGSPSESTVETADDEEMANATPDPSFHSPFADSGGAPTASEDAVPLGTTHQNHPDIQDLMKGRYGALLLKQERGTASRPLHRLKRQLMAASVSFEKYLPHPQATVSASPQDLSPYEIKHRVLQRFYLANIKAGKVLESSWSASSTYPEPSALWPNPLIHNMRLKPFYAPIHAHSSTTGTKPNGMSREASPKAEGAPSEGDAHASQIFGRDSVGTDSNEVAAAVRKNKERLQDLWKYSGSHGISWDTLDEAFIEFYMFQKKRKEYWEERKDSVYPLCKQKARLEVVKRRRAFLALKGVNLEEKTPAIRSALLMPETLVRKRALQLYDFYKTQYLRPWSPGMLSQFLKAVVTEAMLDREEAERLYGLVESDNKVKEFRELRYFKDLVHPIQNTALKETSYSSFSEWDMEGVGQTRLRRLRNRVAALKPFVSPNVLVDHTE